MCFSRQNCLSRSWGELLACACAVFEVGVRNVDGEYCGAQSSRAGDAAGRRVLVSLVSCCAALGSVEGKICTSKHAGVDDIVSCARFGVGWLFQCNCEDASVNGRAIDRKHGIPRSLQIEGTL